VPPAAQAQKFGSYMVNPFAALASSVGGGLAFGKPSGGDAAAKPAAAPTSSFGAGIV